MSDARGCYECQCPCHREANRCMECCDSNTAILTAERDALKAELDAALGSVAEYSKRTHLAEADNERLRAELRLAQPFHRDAIKERADERAQLTELREAAEAACPYIDDDAWRKNLRAVLAKVKP